VTIVAERPSASAAVPDLRRYPGVRFFQEPDHVRFFGRTRATEELLLRVLSVRLLLQFAPSGAGKTSLLNAGLFPLLRPHGYFPFTIRLNLPDESLVQAVTRSLRDAVRDAGLRAPVIPNAAGSVWALLSDAQLWSQELRLLIPVLVFDQFEEVFTLRDHAFRKEFATEIGELSQGHQARTGGDRTGDGGPDVKVIISLREEYLGLLEEMSAAIPDLFRERLRLSPLTPQEAIEAIVEPAKLAGDWLSPQFAFEEKECLPGLIDFIDGVSERVRVIEPLTLQLVCQQAETIATARAAGTPHPTLTLADFGGVAGLERLVHGYYSGEIASVGDSATRKKVVRLFEVGLLDPSGSKRLMLERDEIQRDYGLDETVLSGLVTSRLLRREPRNESVFYEISHDRLTEAIARHRSVRLPRWVLPSLGVAAALIVVLLVSIGVINSARKQAEVASAKTAEALRVLWGDTLVQRLREAGLSDTLQQGLTGASLEGSSDPVVRALQLRRLGELAWERDTLDAAGRYFTAALAALDSVSPEGANGDGRVVEIDAERAQVLKDLGDVYTDKGEVSRAEPSYAEAVRQWEKVLKRNDVPIELSRVNQLNAVEAQIALASLEERLGNTSRAEAVYMDGGSRALEVLRSVYHLMPDPESDSFVLGRAVQIYADVGLGLARLWSFPDDLKGARALAVELRRMRPLSAQARIQLGTASAMYGGAIVSNPRETRRARQLFDEASIQFQELTRFDPRNLRMTRELAAVQLLTAEGIARCAVLAECAKVLRPGELESAEIWALDAHGRFQNLAKKDPGNPSLQDDLSWGKETQALLRRARKAYGDALQLFDEALQFRRASIVDERDIRQRVSVIDLLVEKAQALADSGGRDEALAILEEAANAAKQLPESTGHTYAFADVAAQEAEILRGAGRTKEADALQKQTTALYNEANAIRSARKRKSFAANKEGNDLYSKAGTLSGADRGVAFERSIEKYRESSRDDLLDPVVWSNIRGACVGLAAAEAKAAEAAASADAAAPTPGSHEQKQEAARRCAIESAWMAWVLKDDVEDPKASSAGLKTLYEDRRSLALLLRNDSRRVPDALRLAEQGVREAEALEKQNPSADTLFLLADAYYGLGLMREESNSEGWEEAIRAAIGHAGRLLNQEPRDANHWVWLGQVRTELAKRLEKRKRPGATNERAIAQQMCQAALSLAATTAGREDAQACLNDSRP
jgi:tetratricopeptide (TPR) repeat protein